MISYSPIHLYFYYSWKRLPFVRKIFLNFLPLKIFLQRWELPHNLETKYLFTQSMDREDYNEFVDIVFHSIDSQHKKHIMPTKIIKFNFDCLTLQKEEIKNIWKDIHTTNIFEKLFIFMNIFQVASIQKYLNNYEINILITHADMQPVENYIAQYFKAKNIKTVTLQHGLYIDYTKYPNRNEVNYRSVISDYFLAWGQETKELIEEYHSDCMVVICGNPMIKEITYKPKVFFTVVFDQELFKIYNKKLIIIAQKVAKKTNMKILLKLHPRNNIDDYELDKNLFIDKTNIGDSLFVLGHTTTMMFELMRNGIPVFKYQTEIPSNKFRNDLIFHNVNELIEKLHYKEKINFTNEGKYFINYIDTQAKQKYRDIFKELINE